MRTSDQRVSDFMERHFKHLRDGHKEYTEAEVRAVMLGMQTEFDAQAEALAAVTRERDALLDSSKRLRYALGDPNGEMTAPQLTRRAHELRQKAAKWDDWHDAQSRIETEMPEGWAFVMQCSPGDWDLYLTNPDGERVKFDRDCDTTAQVMGSAIDAARATLTPTAPGAQEQA